MPARSAKAVARPTLPGTHLAPAQLLAPAIPATGQPAAHLALDQAVTLEAVQAAALATATAILAATAQRAAAGIMVSGSVPTTQALATPHLLMVWEATTIPPAQALVATVAATTLAQSSLSLVLLAPAMCLFSPCWRSPSLPGACKWSRAFYERRLI